jgi:hypothetical protein
MEDIFKRFIAEHCEVKKGGGNFVHLHVLHAAFGDYCINAGILQIRVNSVLANNEHLTRTYAMKHGAVFRGTDSVPIMKGI